MRTGISPAHIELSAPAVYKGARGDLTLTSNMKIKSWVCSA